MKIINRPYKDDLNDFKKLWDFIIEDSKNPDSSSMWSLGRLSDWKYGLFREDMYVPNFLYRNAHLWLNSFDELVGYAINEYGESNFNISVKGNYKHLYPQMLEWVIHNWFTEGNGLETEVYENDPLLMEILIEKNFVNEGKCGTTRKYILANRLDEINLEAGFKVQDAIENNDFTGRLYLRRNGFRNQNTITKIDVLADEYYREEGPIYNPYYDISVTNASGLHVAGCIAFVNYESSSAEIERVCTHQDFRKRGLCEAAIRECFNHLKKEHIKYATITGFSLAANGLYSKLGADEEKSMFSFSLK